MRVYAIKYAAAIDELGVNTYFTRYGAHNGLCHLSLTQNDLTP